jgi:hypothetical protein
MAINRDPHLRRYLALTPALRKQKSVLRQQHVKEVEARASPTRVVREGFLEKATFSWDKKNKEQGTHTSGQRRIQAEVTASTRA